ncbi:hypothetical protein C8F04DRAFT_1258619 [Mycena alexandri]|uniref:TLC domain-containing protein n=1 Tax=Mycena alexandri TaxID=1745969 RepID=A0AAD6X1U3_9AGAR|nr:hypothetical protein C8F04DRAFT_1258619 [Mycena alexandri]
MISSGRAKPRVGINATPRTTSPPSRPSRPTRRPRPSRPAPRRCLCRLHLPPPPRKKAYLKSCRLSKQLGHQAIMRTTPAFRFRTAFFWRDYPHTHLSGAMKRYYVVHIGYWVQQWTVLLLGLDKRRSDYWEYMVHHVTVWMCTFWMRASGWVTEAEGWLRTTHDRRYWVARAGCGSAPTGCASPPLSCSLPFSSSFPKPRVRKTEGWLRTAHERRY